MQDIVLIAHNIRSCHNIGSILRTADGLGVSLVVMSGYTPYPKNAEDTRLPHEAEKITKYIHKTALGAEDTVPWVHMNDLPPFVAQLQSKNYIVYGLEQAKNSIPLPNLVSNSKVALIVGNELSGLEKDIAALCDGIVEIPMFGSKESYNVACAAAMALYHCRFFTETKVKFRI